MYLITASLPLAVFASNIGVFAFPGQEPSNAKLLIIEPEIDAEVFCEMKTTFAVVIGVGGRTPFK